MRYQPERALTQELYDMSECQTYYVEMRYQPERALTRSKLLDLLISATSCRNEISAREGIDTLDTMFLEHL